MILEVLKSADDDGVISRVREKLPNSPARFPCRGSNRPDLTGRRLRIRANRLRHTFGVTIRKPEGRQELHDLVQFRGEDVIVVQRIQRD